MHEPALVMATRVSVSGDEEAEPVLILAEPAGMTELILDDGETLQFRTRDLLEALSASYSAGARAA